MKKMIKMLTVLLALTLLLAACGKTPTTDLGGSGTLTLMVNPEIRIHYDGDGNVTALEGKNDDARQLLEAYTGYEGKACSIVLDELLRRIHQAGYFVEDIDGGKKTVVLQLEPGSAVPQENFLQNMGKTMQNTVNSLNAGSGVVTIDDRDYDLSYGDTSPYITLQKAEEIALSHAGLTSATFKDKEFDLEDGAPVYELEFTQDQVKYEYLIDALSGKVLKSEKEALSGSQTQQPTTPVTPAPTYITLQQAVDIALNHAGLKADQVTFEDREFDIDDGAAAYKLEFKTDSAEYEYEIDAVTGKILDVEMDSHKTPGATKPAATKPTESKSVTLDEAKKIALEHAGVKAADATFEKAELNKEDGVYELEFFTSTYEYDYEINAASGKVVKSEKEKQDDVPAATTPSATYISQSKAKSIALEKAGIKSATFKSVELDKEDGVYELEFYTSTYEYDYEIDAVTGKVLKAEKERVEADDDDDKVPTGQTYISKSKAKSLALKKAGLSSATFQSVELDEDDGKAVYELEFTSGKYEYECTIDAVTGKVLDYEKDTKD